MDALIDHTAIEAVYRHEAGRVLATLIRLVGDFELAEEGAQDAFEAALARWPQMGLPANPRAWLVNTGRNKAIDRLRRRIALRGLSTALMGDLVDTCRTIKAEKITLHAERTGRYAWAMFGFVPDASSWAQMKRDALVFLLSNEPILGPERTNDFVRRINKGGPDAIRIIASINDPVPSRQLPHRFELEMVPFARAFFLEQTGDWYGSLSLGDDATMKLVDGYRQAKKGSAQ